MVFHTIVLPAMLMAWNDAHPEEQTRAPGGTNEVFTISNDEALKIEAQIQRIMDARQKALEQTKPIIIER